MFKFVCMAEFQLDLFNWNFRQKPSLQVFIILLSMLLVALYLAPAIQIMLPCFLIQIVID